MGSFANSLHVKCDDAKLVVSSINDVLQSSGYTTTDEDLSDDIFQDRPELYRAIFVADSHNGWVSLLDSDLEQQISLASELSKRLQTPAIYFLVNDSDSWCYRAFRSGSQFDEFDSSVESSFEQRENTHETATTTKGGSVSIQEAMTQRARELKEQLKEEMPSDIRHIHERMESQAVTKEELKRYRKWERIKTDQQFRDMKSMVMGMIMQRMPPLVRQSVSESDLRTHFQKLRPILLSDVTEIRVLEVLGKQSLFAEENLGEFMALLGIQPFFANLSYRYIQDCQNQEMEESDIRIVEHLRFTR